MQVLGENDEIIKTLLPFAKRKSKDFWVWQFLGDASYDSDMRFACYCKALTCIKRAKEEMLVSLREGCARMMLNKSFYSEAKREIEIVVKTRYEKWGKITTPLEKIINQDWYKETKATTNNEDFYYKHSERAKELLYLDSPKYEIVVIGVNKTKNVLNFATKNGEYGYFYNDELVKNLIKIGDTFLIKVQKMRRDKPCKVLSIKNIENNELKESFVKYVDGKVIIPPGKHFGFVDGVYINPNIVARYSLVDGCEIKGTAIYDYNPKTNKMSWRMVLI